MLPKTLKVQDDCTFKATYDADTVKNLANNLIGSPLTVCYLHFMPSRAYRTSVPSPHKYYLSSVDFVREGEATVSFGF